MRLYSREQIQKLFVQICRDSNYQLDAATAAHLGAKVLGCSPLGFWIEIGTIDTMDRIANGSFKPVFRDDPA